MIHIGVSTIPTDLSTGPDELALWAEEVGFDSFFVGEHSHIPTSRASRWPFGGEQLPDYYKRVYDPVVALTAAAGVTQRIALGTSVFQVPLHHPIHLAKSVACLDRVSDGRFVCGIGGGWNAEEMASHGVAFADRWKVTRERVLAMRALWTQDVAEYHGELVDIAPCWCWPKPLQEGGPPVWMGAGFPWLARHIVEYCDGWLAIDGFGNPLATREAIRVEAERVGRDPDALAYGIIVQPESGSERIGELARAGFDHILVHVASDLPEAQRLTMKRCEEVLRRARRGA